MTESTFTCPKCGSQNTKKLKSGDVYCKDCEHEFVPEAPFEPLRVFISYGHDEHVAVALRLRDDLNQRGHEAWFDEERLHPGHDWEASIERGLQWAAQSGQKAALVLLLTPHSVRRPDGYCLNEVARALTLGLRIIPLMVVDSEPPLSICRIQWLDLRECIPIHEREDRYAPKVERLLAALEQNRLDFEGTQSLLLRALAPMEFSARILEKLQDFTGRQWVFDQVDRWMNDPAGSKIFWLTGAPGVGKTAVAAWVQQHRREVAAFHFCDIHHEEKRNPAKMVRSIAYQLSTQLPEYEARLAQLNPGIEAIVPEYHEAYTLFDKLVIQPLTTAFPAPDRTLVVLIDALDEATFERQNEIAHFLGSCAHLTPPWLRFLVTSRPDEPEIKPHLQSLDPYVLDTAREENLADLREYLRVQLPGITAAQTDEIVSRSEGVFLYVTHVTEEVKVGRLSLDRLEEFPRGLGDVYAGFFKRQFGKELAFYEEKITPLLQVVFAAFEPLTLADLKAVCHLPDATELGRRLNRLGSLFPTRGHGDTATLVPFHRSLVDWITDRSAAGHYWLDVRDGHRLLAEQGLAQYRTGVAALSPYQLRYLPAHLCELGHWDALAGDDNTPGVLTDLRYVQAKCTAGLTHDLVGDYNQVLSQMPGAQDDSTEAAVRVRHFSNFLSHHLGVLSEYPEGTLPIAVNYADSGPVVSQAELLLDEGKVPHLRRTNRPPLIPLRPACLLKAECHNGWINSLVIKFDGKRFITGSINNIQIWDIETGECLRILTDHKRQITNVVLTPDGKYIISGSDDNSIIVWDIETGVCLRILNGQKKIDEEKIAIIPAGKRIFSESKNKYIQFWDDETGNSTLLFMGINQEDVTNITETPEEKRTAIKNVTSVAVTPDGRHIVSGSGDLAISVWDFETGECLRVLKGHKQRLRSLTVTPDGKRIVTGSLDKTIRVWDLGTGECMRVLEGHNEQVSSVAVTPDHKHIVSGGDDKTIRVWDMESGECLRVLYGHKKHVTGVVVTPDGKYIVSGSNDRTIRVWDMETGECLRVLYGHEWDVTSVAVTPDGERIVSGSFNNIRVWNLQMGEYQRLLDGHQKDVTSLALTPDGKCIVSGSNDRSIRVWDMETGVHLRVLNGYKKDDTRVTATPDGKRIISGSNDRTIRVWDMETSKCQFEFMGHHEYISSLAVTPDGKRIVSGSIDRTIRVWDIETGECLRVLYGHEWAVTIVAVTSGNKCVSGSDDKTIRLWDVQTRECLRVFYGHENYVSSVAILPDGIRIISGSGDTTIRVWDLETGECLRVLMGHKGVVRNVALSPNVKRIVSGGSDSTVRIWNLETGQQLYISVFTSPATAIAVSPQGDRIVAGTEDGQIHILTPVNFTLSETPVLTEL